ncbi:histidine phosphatase family protein [Devosia sp.]|uniref:histidine phosphatase family protein n=1 Tax=Devosia sp. TaxID=1871048 RepID=UPI001ACC4B16|nr:histidine phosphatase family protein [Devosia sp.]MBN9333926.1 histidine phosphatase family protein [Devosia sp.]
MKTIVLIRHAAPTVVEDAASNGWVLSDGGRKAAMALASRLLGFGFAELLSSPEPKAMQTAQILADRIGSQTHIDVRLREHDRRSVGFLEREIFEARIASIFDRPEEVTYGDESADAVHVRFSAAIDDAMSRSSGSVAAVTHGTAMTIYVSRLVGIVPMPFWTKLAMPAAIVIKDGVVADVVQ